MGLSLFCVWLWSSLTPLIHAVLHVANFSPPLKNDYFNFDLFVLMHSHSPSLVIQIQDVKRTQTKDLLFS